mgnify:CR=1 FL=1
MVLVLLQAKKPLRSFAGRLDDADRKALAQLVLVGFVVLPSGPWRTPSSSSPAASW